MKALNRIAKVLSAGLSTLTCALITACGGDGGSNSGPSSIDTDVLVADIDGDGRSDVLTLSHWYGEGSPAGEGRLVVYRQVSAGVFAAPETYVFGCYPWSMTLSDIDGDGRPDLVVADPGSGRECSDPSSGYAVHLMLQDPTQLGRFLPSRKLIGDVNAYQAAVGDFNGDGAPDIAVGGSGRRLLLRMQDPARRGEFSAPIDMAMPGQVADIVAGDIDGDGRADLFAHLYLDSTGYTPNSVLAVLLQQPGGLFGAPLQLAPQTGLNVQQLALGDADGDGRTDLIAHFTPFGTDYQPKLTVLLQGASALSWSAPVDTSLAGINGTDHTAFGDLNADGRPDVVLVGVFPVGDNFPEWHSQANVFLNSGAARFRLAAGYGLTGTVSASAVGIGDVDGDGRNDLVLFGDGNVVMVMLQSHSVAGSFETPKPIR